MQLIYSLSLKVFFIFYFLSLIGQDTVLWNFFLFLPPTLLDVLRIPST